jgi:two-component system sensor histidine kinase KdpD
MAAGKRGQLKIFFGYWADSEKVAAMLREAVEARAQGLVVLAGMPFSAPESLGDKLEFLPAASVNGTPFFDLDSALKRKPNLILVENLAESNPEFCCHRKRYQDVEELLNRGISVYTTLNAVNLESLQDTVAAITGITEWECVPDSVFDRADQVELVDMEPQILFDRQKGGRAAEMTLEQLAALREIALRCYAERIKRIAETIRERNGFHTDEHILACLSSAPSNAKIIRTAARMARAFNSRFTALFVETPDFAAASAEDKERLQGHRKLAEQMGASVETVYGEDVPYQIAEYARLSGVTKIVLGRSALTRRHRLGSPTLTERLLGYIPELDVHIIPDQSAGKEYQPQKVNRHSRQEAAVNSAKSIAILLGATLLSLLFERLGFTDANIIMVYILGVLLTSVVTSHRLYSLISSVASVLIFNYLFTEPRLSLSAYETGYPVTFLVMFLTAYITGTLALRYKNQAGQSAKSAYRTKVLFDTDQLLSKAKGKDEILRLAGTQIEKLLSRNVVVFENNGGALSEPRLYPRDNGPAPVYDSEVELPAANWVLANNHAAGAGTDTMSNARYYYLAIRVNDRVYGVVGIEAEAALIEASEHGMLLSLLGETALALENDRNAREKENAAIQAERERLRANLLRTISHDLRTPLTSISGNASNLLQNGDSFDAATKRQIYSDLYEDAMWLVNLVENLLYSTRIEDGRMILSVVPELLADIMNEAMGHTAKHSASHALSSHCEDELLVVKGDAKLLAQVIINLVDNAVKYTPAGSKITVTAERSGAFALVSVADTGNGIPDGEKEKVFDKFYCGNHKIADNRRSLGLGLYLCKAIVEAHGGRIWVENRQPHGAVFRFTLPLEEVFKLE